ncbi:MAG: ferrochelatase [Bacteroidetes bacterium]|nr:MAG: ferrochelatase [Bacteroidota bacterium]MBL1145917.1 ferrochelatase [Bacteroidota bacterium]MCB0801571.1 ferrochelatase [Flavobacteriales bacterium]NOG58711.1 ferrochelatase [Bacteroidota bacterium]
MSKTGVLLINLGTPDDAKIGAVRRYLSEFLNDPRVIDISWLARKLLVNLIIVPFRAKGSTKIYKELWTEKGSPLMYHGESVKEKLQNQLGGEFGVHLAMRYQNPSLEKVLGEMRLLNYNKIIIIPLFPHYASASSGSAMEKALRIISKWWVIPEISMMSQFWDHPKFIDAFVARANQYKIEDYDHVLFSYHGLPVRQVDKVYDDGKPCDDHDCETEITEDNKYCYKATCFATTRLLAERLNIPKEKYTVAFQSRLDKNWLEPFSDKVVEERAKKGDKKILAFSPAFIADCLETTVEIGSEYQEIFEEHGGEKVQLVESLNDHPIWIDALEDMVRARV